MSEQITGYIDHIIYRNEDNGYTVLVLKMAGEDEMTCVGTFPDITQGATIEAIGSYTKHAAYGRQFQITSFVEKAPWPPGSSGISARIPSASWRRSRNGWRR